MDIVTLYAAIAYVRSHGGFDGLKVKVVSELPMIGDSQYLYLVLSSVVRTGSLYDEYLWVDGAWEEIGANIDLSDYYTKAQADLKFADKDSLGTAAYADALDSAESIKDNQDSANLTSAKQVAEFTKENHQDLTFIKNGESAVYNGFNPLTVNLPYNVSELVNDANYMSSDSYASIIPVDLNEQPWSTALSSTYQKMKYLEFDGNQYFDLGIYPNQKVVTELTFESNLEIGYIFGTVTPKGNYDFKIDGLSEINMNEAKIQFTLIAGYHKLKINNEYIQIDDDTIYQFGTVTDFNSNNPLYLGTTNNDITQGFKGKLYTFKMWEEDTLTVDLIPVYRKADNIIGLVDLVSQQNFYTNLGSKSFEKQPDDVKLTEGQLYKHTGTTTDDFEEYNVYYYVNNSWHKLLNEQDIATKVSTHNTSTDAHSDLFSTKESTDNKVTTLSADSTDTQYPSAKCVYDLIGDITSLLSSI